ncbi:gamma-glutamyl-gamma-aminobutyrate hydrolase family protein [Persicimonas caeni]|uniref:Gamma-glutamyl-gamma-aminobutyrate hydrolase family protein n=1 Tax=Persicimonas caeni TaxID=2292766 RepID=A0A4Y6PSK5_PERCE|nr:gamma-glutamyl-gamma-aminobutyrate hydrolase family protein [Persicimonas caeni]QDG50755.1 gamma-glutamyl-gamma-aminobutyrate hydrolase family protein [Persicimonas caeni]QED31976.1 gamma-glutamyl-gamma-aminobutyrate hydrolase family protein [Persicimonas caeni]
MIRTSARIGVSASVFHEDPDRRVYNGRPLLYLEQSMATWLMEAGVRPYVIPFAPEGVEVATSLHDLVEGLDGVVLQGGVDVAPETYGEAHMSEQWPGDAVRDAYEIALVRACLEHDKPLLGICRGHQILNVARGGTLYQDVPTQVDDPLAHMDRPLYERNYHPIAIEPESRLSGIYGGKTRGLVNSVHHQAIKDVGEGLVIEARAAGDGVVEAVRLDSDERWAMGLQWHPEFQHADEDELLDRFAVIDAFLQAVDARR